MSVLRLSRLAPVAAAVALALAAPAAAVAPKAVPDRLPVLSEPLGRGGLVVTKAAARTPSRKVADGLPGDWKGRASRISGTSRLDAGEHIYTDFLFDDYGADDGEDAQRLSVLGPVRDAESRTARIDQLFQAAGDQFGAPRPFGALDHYGDGERTNAADLREVRWAADRNSLDLLVRTTTLTDNNLGVVALFDTRKDDGAKRDIGFGTGLSTTRFDRAVLLDHRGAITHNLVTGSYRTLARPVAVTPDGWTNTLEASLPASWFSRTVQVGLLAGKTGADFGTITPANVAYRSKEPVAGVYNDQRQALALHAGNVDEFGTALDLKALRSGASQSVRPGPGYAERHMRSGTNISKEEGEHGIWQPYGLYVPTTYKPSKKTPLTFWLHYRGGKAHSGGAWTPRLITQLGEEQGNIVVTPRGRGTSTWYVSESHQDFFEVFADVHRTFNVDPDRRYLSGYSMGGYGTYLFGLLYPDLFAAGYSTSGAPTQGAWTGEGPDDCRTGSCFVEANNGDADAQLTYRILENAQNFPLAIHHGTNDELVPVSGIQRIGARLLELGYRYDLTTFVGYEHFTQAIVDEWADGAEYINSFERVRDPRRVTYKVVPALVNAVNTVTTDGVDFNFNPDGAYWVDGLRVREGDPKDPSTSGQISAASASIPAKDWLPLPRTGAVSPLGHSTPYVRHGLDWLETGDDLIGNGFNATLTNLSRASLDVSRMNLTKRQTHNGSITTDGPTTLVLRNLAYPTRVYLGDKLVTTSDSRATLRLPAGEHRIELRPAR